MCIRDSYVTEDNPVRVVDVFVEQLDLGQLGFEGVDPSDTGRPAYHPTAVSYTHLDVYKRQAYAYEDDAESDYSETQFKSR